MTNLDTYKLRPADHSCAKRIFDAFKLTVGPYIADAWGWDDDYQIISFWQHHPLDQFQIIEVNNQFAGGLHLEVGNDVYIRMIFLLPEYQNLGIGRLLIKDLYGRFSKQNKVLRLKVIKTNPARKLYEQLGFQITSVDDKSQDMCLRPA